MKILVEKRAWAYPWTAQIFGVRLSQERRKATDFKFCTHIHRIDRNKNPFKMPGKVAVYSGTPEIFQGTHI